MKEADMIDDYARLIPADKKLDPAWLRALTARGEPLVYSEPKALEHIGMPVGGLFAGTVYLGGDGRLWLWNVLNDDREGIVPREVHYHGQDLKPRDGANYVSPAQRSYPFEQNFALRVGGKRHTLDADGFAEVSFSGQYPIGEVSYADSACPVDVSLTAFSPFIPLNTPDSTLPCTIMSYRLRSHGANAVSCELSGWLENPVCLRSGVNLAGRRNNRVVSDAGVTALECTAATIEIVEKETESGDNIGVDQVEQSDAPVFSGPLEDAPDFGSMVLAVLDGGGETFAAAGSREATVGIDAAPASGSLTDSVVGSVGRTLTLKPGETQTVTFVLAWHFPNLTAGRMENVGREYASRFEDALGVARYVASSFDRLSRDTKLWRDTWYDSTLPYWFLDRTMANTSTLATTTAYRFRDGRFWAWEGVGCCRGTCTHVWHYAQALGRLFPDVERRHREEVDFGLAQHPDGSIGMRADLEGANHVADDGHCGRILGAYREHQMSPDDAFLRRIWPNIKRAIQFMINRDANRDGILEGAQHNTLDAAWYGRISFLATLYLAMLRAGEAMATEMGDTAFAEACSAIAEKGATTLLELYNGEYFFHELDPDHLDTVAVGSGCYVDQVFGQFWAHQVGLGHLFEAEKARSALKALYTYNFVPHVGRFRETFTRGRWYANEDDKGLIMCSWPKGGLNDKWYNDWQFMYFNECMSGFEWQAAAHMISEGLVEKGLSVSRAIYDRYDAHRRNPYNEIECSDHYSRAMASYGAFLAACGYEAHGPKGHLGFAPKVREGDTFKCAFTAAEGWGTYEETRTCGVTSRVHLKFGTLKLKTLGVDVPVDATVRGYLGDTERACTIEVISDRTRVVFAKPIALKAGGTLRVEVMK